MTALALLALLGAACAKPDDPGVSVSTLSADIVFGVKEPDQPVSPFSGPATPVAAGEGTANVDLPEEVFQDDNPLTPKSKSFPRPSLRATSQADCPPAAQNAFPEEQAFVNIFDPATGEPAEPRMPRAGLYRWKKEGTQITETQGFKIETPISGFEQRLVKNVKELRKTATQVQYSFDTVQPVTGGQLTTSYFIDSAARSAEVAPTASNIRASGGAPERGLVLRALEATDKSGNRLAPPVRFIAGEGLLLVPLPIRTGERFRSVAVDPASGTTMQNEGQVINRVQVDACGEVLSGWLVKGRLSSRNLSQTYEIVFATQFGGILIQQKVDEVATSPRGRTTSKITFTQGQKDPDPLPAG